MIQKCSLMRVAGIFFKEPTSIHFIKEIGKKIKLAPTSVRKHIQELKKEGIIIEKKAFPFSGFVANLENDKFLFYKRAFNLFSIYELKDFIVNTLAPSAIILFGSYSRGEDTENSDLDILIIRKTKKEVILDNFEKSLSRKIHLTSVSSIEDLEKNIKENVKRGILLYGTY